MASAEEHTGHAPVTNGSVKHVLCPESCGTDILDSGKTVSDYINSKMKELGAKGIDEPFYVVSLDSMYKRHLRWLSNLPRVKPFYAVKCNNTPAVLRWLNALDTGFDCASKGEIELALSLGVAPDKIIYAHTTKPMSHIRYACAQGVNLMTFDNEEELKKISLCHPKAKLVLRIAVDDSESLVRLSSKFGATVVSAGKLLEQAAELGLEVTGVSFHVGSGCKASLPFRQAIEDVRHIFDIANLMGFKMKLVDIGGGFSGLGEFQQKFEEFSEVINKALDEYFPSDSGVQVIAEPGRFYVETAFTLATNVFAKRVNVDDEGQLSDGEKNSHGKIMMYYVNDGVYGSLSCLINDPVISKLDPYLLRVVDSSEQRYRSVIWGPTCDSLDKITDDYWIPELHVGDWLLIDDMGAYSNSLSSDFNGFERAHIYPVATAEMWHVLNHSVNNNCIQ